MKKVKLLLVFLAVMLVLGATGCLFESDFDDIYSILLSELTIDFGSVETGYEPQQEKKVIIGNNGERATGALKIELSGEDADAFILNQQSINNIGVGRSATFSVMPATGLEKKNYTANIIVSGGNGINVSSNVIFIVTGLETLEGNISIQLPEDVNEDAVPYRTQLTASYDGGEEVSFQWNKDGDAIQGANTHLFTPEEPGEYTVTAILEGYLSKTSSAVTVEAREVFSIELEITLEDNDFGIDDAGRAIFNSDDPVILNNANTSKTLSLAGQGFSNINWHLGVIPLASGETCVLEYEAFNAGNYTLTITFTKDGKLWSGDLSFTVIK